MIFWGHIAALVRSPINGLEPFERTIEQTAETMLPNPKTITAAAITNRITSLRELLHYRYFARSTRYHVNSKDSHFAPDMFSSYEEGEEGWGRRDGTKRRNMGCLKEKKTLRKPQSSLHIPLCLRILGEPFLLRWCFWIDFALRCFFESLVFAPARTSHSGFLWAQVSSKYGA